jgi:hypothetical protein
MYRESFHNTIEETGQTLLQFEAEALTQENLVMEIFRRVNRPLAWGEVRGLLPGDMHEVSIKRSITNLANRGTLKKTGERVMGPYGKQTHGYALIK